MRVTNDKAQALRYLLLRHAKQYKEIVPRSVYNNTTLSIKVVSIDNGFLVKRSVVNSNPPLDTNL